MSYLTKEQFVATRHTPTDEEWAQLQKYAAEEGVSIPGREYCILYEDMYLIHKAEDGYYSHAWWYSPNRNATLKEAEEDQYNWYKQFANDPNKGRKYEIRVSEKQRKQLLDALHRLIKSDDVITSEEHELLHGMLEKLPDSDYDLNDFTI